LQQKRAVVHRMAPFTIRLKDRERETSRLQHMRIKIDPGAKKTGMVLLREQEEEPAHKTEKHPSYVIWAGEIHHKTDIKEKLDKRRALRRGRRSRKTRYRKPRFSNRPRKRCRVCGGNTPKRPRGGRADDCRVHYGQKSDRKKRIDWLPPSLTARREQTVQAVQQLKKLAPLTAISVEHVKFDTQLLQNPDIQDVEYQQGTLWGYEVKEYLLEKFNRQCAYCQGKSRDTILEVDHVIPRQPTRGQAGTDRISNLVIACRACNEAKGNTQPEDWRHQLLRSTSSLDRARLKGLDQVVKQLKRPLKAAAFLNAVRWALYKRLQSLMLPVECGTGALTKLNRLTLGFPKGHIFDAACVGASTPPQRMFHTAYMHIWQATGRGTRQLSRVNKAGFPIAYRSPGKLVFGFQTGDLVVADVPTGKYPGRWRGRVAVRASGYFDLKDHQGRRLCQGISYNYCRVLQHANGWYYTHQYVPPLTYATTFFISQP
ncbi:MAG: RNA-guided endonuclease IscB, partial [Candidatus Hermodarchaeota archaeon]